MLFFIAFNLLRELIFFYKMKLEVLLTLAIFFLNFRNFNIRKAVLQERDIIFIRKVHFAILVYICPISNIR